MCVYRNIFSKRKSFISDHILQTHFYAAVARVYLHTCFVERKKS